MRSPPRIFASSTVAVSPALADRPRSSWAANRAGQTPQTQPQSHLHLLQVPTKYNYARLHDPTSDELSLQASPACSPVCCYCNRYLQPQLRRQHAPYLWSHPGQHAEPSKWRPAFWAKPKAHQVLDITRAFHRRPSPYSTRHTGRAEMPLDMASAPAMAAKETAIAARNNTVQYPYGPNRRR
jgi:hypothetical protein